VTKAASRALASHPDSSLRPLSTLSTLNLESLELLELRQRSTAPSTDNEGRDSTDVSDQRGIGYDIESKTPEGEFRFIKVEARHPEADSISVTRNEIVAALDDPGSFRLAIVIVDDGEAQEPVYVEEPWDMESDSYVTSVQFHKDELLAKAETKD